jgi:hypothetical protein
MVGFILLPKPFRIRSSKLCSSIVVLHPCSFSLAACNSPTFPFDCPHASDYKQYFRFLLPTFTAIMVYTPLDPTQKEIRLLHLVPALNHDDPLVCSFSLASFDEDVDYEALSYAWGDVTPVMPVILEGKEVLITKNLHSALCHLRYLDQQRILWPDALCINQSDLRERTHQVSLMSSIYSRASSVLVWLGEAWEGCELAMEMLKQLGSNESLHVFKSLNPSFSIHGMDLGSAELRDHLYRFFSSPWWNRLCKCPNSVSRLCSSLCSRPDMTSTNSQLLLGTVQEHALASDVVFQYGQHTLNVELAIRARRNILTHVISRDCCRQLMREDDKHNYQETGECLNALWFLYVVKANMKLRSIIYWISLFASREVSDPRDKVYGLLGLAVGDEIGMVEPDYTSFLEEVFYAAALGSIERNKNLDVLSYLVGERADQLPSFVPDWTHQPDFKEYWLRLNFLGSFSAATDTIARVEEVATGKLAVIGILVDSILENPSRMKGGKRSLRNISSCSTRAILPKLYIITQEKHERLYGGLLYAEG